MSVLECSHFNCVFTENFFDRRNFTSAEILRDRTVGDRLNSSLSGLEVLGAIPGPVKSDYVTNDSPPLRRF